MRQNMKLKVGEKPKKWAIMHRNGIYGHERLHERNKENRRGAWSIRSFSGIFRAAFPGGQSRSAGASGRRARQRQGAGSSEAPLSVPALGRAVRGPELRGAFADADRSRTVRS